MCVLVRGSESGGSDGIWMQKECGGRGYWSREKP